MFAQLTGWCSNFMVWFRDSTAFVRPSMAACNFFAFLFLHFKISCFCASCSFKLFVIASNWSYFLQVAAGVWVHNIICSWSYIPDGIMYNFWHILRLFILVFYTWYYWALLMEQQQWSLWDFYLGLQLSLFSRPQVLFLAHDF